LGGICTVLKQCEQRIGGDLANAGIELLVIANVAETTQNTALAQFNMIVG
jgi:hypothetical protein